MALGVVAPVSIADLRVLEVAGSVAGAYAGRLLALVGASVTRLGPPLADPIRSAYLDQGKASATESDLADLAATADVVIESSAPDPLDPRCQPGPAQIALRLSPFGPDGPYSEWRSTSCTDYAIAGHLRLNGDPEREPLQGPPDIPALAAGCFGAIGALAALFERLQSGRGQLVEVTHHDTLAALHQFTLLRYTHTGSDLNRMGNRYAGPGNPIGAYPCQDGSISIAIALEDQMERMAALTGLDTLLAEGPYQSLFDIFLRAEVLLPPLLEWLSGWTTADLVPLLQDLRIPAGPLLLPSQLPDDPHLAARGFFSPLTGPDGPALTGPDGPVLTRPDGSAISAPGPPFRLSRSDGSGGTGGTDPKPRPATSEAPAAASQGPLSGIRVLDLTRVWAGPLAGRILADLGADVVWVESPWSRGSRQLPDSYVRLTGYYPGFEAGSQPWNRNGFVHKFSLNKRSLALDLATEAGAAAFARLVPAVDVVLENYAPRVMPNLGFDAERLAVLNPSLTYTTMPGYGLTGPCRDWVAFGPTVDGHAGHAALMGYPGEDPHKCGIAWPDPIAGMHAAVATIAALYERQCDPVHRGGVVEIPQLETAVSMLGAEIVHALAEGDPPRRGNRHPVWAPQGVYPAAGEDRWVAVSVTDDRAWHGLCEVLGWVDRAGWDVDRRRVEHDQVDAAISAWTCDLEPAEAARRLQAAGVPAGAVTTADEVVADPHLAARGSFVQVDHPLNGSHPWVVLPCRLSRTPATYRRRAPLLGEHNEEVLAAWGGLGADDIAALATAGDIATEPPE